MKPTFLLIFSILCLAGCKMENYCAKHYPPQIHDSIQTVITYCWDTVYKVRPERVISFDTTNLFPDDIVFHREETKDGLTAYIDINKGKLKFQCKEVELRDSIAYLKKEIATTELQTKIIKELCERKHKTGFDSFGNWFFWFVLALAVIRGLLKYFTGK